MLLRCLSSGEKALEMPTQVCTYAIMLTPCSGEMNEHQLAVYHEHEDTSSSKERTINCSWKGDKYLPLLVIYASTEKPV